MRTLVLYILILLNVSFLCATVFAPLQNGTAFSTQDVTVVAVATVGLLATAFFLLLRD